MTRLRPPTASGLSVPLSTPANTAAMALTAGPDVTISEWMTDCVVARPNPASSAPTSVSATGFVDFDALESVHVTASLRNASEIR